MGLLRRLVDLGVSDAPSVTDAKHVRMTNVVAVLLISSSLTWVVLGLLGGQRLPLAHPMAQSLFLLPVLALNARGHAIAAAANLHLVMLASVVFGTWLWGAEGRTTIGTLILIPIPYLLLPHRARTLTHVLAGLPVLVGAGLEFYADSFPAQAAVMPLAPTRAVNMLLGGGGLWVAVLAFAWQVTGTEAALDEERHRSDRLLLNVLPPSIAARLKVEPERTIADKHPEVTVLFADVVGFTPLSATMTPSESVALLNGIFTDFDAICTREGVEKVRTIGDGYMVVAGAPEARKDHALAMVRVARAMLTVMAAHPSLEVRVGINSGEAVAAIVGTTRFHYDVWGDAVNVAARMESMGEPGRIHIAAGTWERVRDVVPCVSRGPILVKGKGMMETWFVSEDG